MRFSLSTFFAKKVGETPLVVSPLSAKLKFTPSGTIEGLGISPSAEGDKGLRAP